MTSNEFQVLKGKDCVLSLSHGLKHCVNIGLDESSFGSSENEGTAVMRTSIFFF